MHGQHFLGLMKLKRQLWSNHFEQRDMGYVYGATNPIVLGKDDLVSRKIGYNVWSGVTVNNVTYFLES